MHQRRSKLQNDWEGVKRKVGCPAVILRKETKCLAGTSTKFTKQHASFLTHSGGLRKKKSESWVHEIYFLVKYTTAETFWSCKNVHMDAGLWAVSQVMGNGTRHQNFDFAV